MRAWLIENAVEFFVLLFWVGITIELWRWRQRLYPPRKRGKR